MTRDEREDEEEAPVELVAVEHPLVVSHATGFLCGGCARQVEVRENVVSVAEASRETAFSARA